MTRGAIGLSGGAPPSATQEVELIRLCLRGDPQAEAEFGCRYGRLVQAVLHRVGVSDSEREDLFQEVFLQLWQDDRRRLRLWQGRGTGKFGAYLAVVTARIAADHFRAMGRSQSMRGDSGISLNDLAGPNADRMDLFEDYHRREQVRAIRHHLPKLSERDGIVLQRRHLYGQSYRELAEGMGLTVNHIGVVLARAEDRLRRSLCRSRPDLFADESRPGSMRPALTGVRRP